MFLKRKNIVFALAVTSALFASRAFAADNDTGVSRMNYSSINNEQKAGQLGVGLQVGNLTGATFEYWTDSLDTVNAGINSVSGNLGINVSHNWLFRNAFAGNGRYSSYFVPYIGAGGLAVFGTQQDYFSNSSNQNFTLAAQIPLGIELLPTAQRFSVFLEVAPSVEVIPVVAAFMVTDLGARFYF